MGTTSCRTGRSSGYALKPWSPLWGLGLFLYLLGNIALCAKPRFIDEKEINMLLLVTKLLQLLRAIQRPLIAYQQRHTCFKLSDYTVRSWDEVEEIEF